MERPSQLRLLVLLALVVGATAAAAQPRLVVNLNREPDPLPADPHTNFGVEHEGVRYFRGKDPQHGYELWRTDGTEAGTYRLTDLCPGRCDGLGTIFGFVGERLLFQGFDGGGPDLWSTDGTPGGEVAVADLCAGPCQPIIGDKELWQGRLWLLTGREGAGRMLWVSDGTAGGTLRLGHTCRDFRLCAPNEDDEFVHFLGVAPEDRGLLVSALAHDSACLYRTDGTAAGSVLLRCSPRIPFPASVSADSPFYFFLEGPELWRTDGTPEGTMFVRDLRDLVGPISFSVDAIRSFGTHCHLLIRGQWLRSDGTAEGTVNLGQMPFRGQFGRIGSRVYLISDNGVWSTEGTPETARRLVEFFGGAERILTSPTRLFVLGFADEPFLWTTDGTPAGTHRISLPPGPPLEYYHLDVAEFAGGVLFSRGRQELWSVDAGGTLVRPVHRFGGPEAPSWLDHQIVLGDRLLFFAMDRASFDEPAFGPFGTVRLYASNGTASGTDRLTPNAVAAIDDREFAHPPFDPSFFKIGSRVFFNGAGISVTDGTAAGTIIASPSSSLVSSRPIGALGDRLLFAGTTHQVFCSDETELWVTTGTTSSTKRLVDLNPTTSFGGSRCEDDPHSSNPGPGVTLGSRVLFAAEDGVHGRELFVTDGTKAGSKLLLNIQRDRPGGLGSAPSDFVRLGRKALFVADDGITGRELWASNGTAQGTYRVADLLPGALGSAPRQLVVSGSWVYFFAKAGRREALYRTDGTAHGTTLVSDLTRNGTPAIAGAELVVSGGHLFFPAFAPDTGLELWRSSGTAATTGLVQDLWPGPRSSTPQRLTALHNGVLFAATDGETGLESWWSNGARTLSLGDIAPGPDASNPGPFQAVGNRILTGADDGLHGRELWAIPLAAIPRP